ncbi:MAG: GrpB family protein, partial [Bacteroidota bacterium]
KSVIDMLMEVKDLERLDQQNLAMEKLGYEVMGEYGIAGRRYFRKGHPLRTHHLHAFASGDSNILRHIAFRDYLVAHSEIARAYADLKRDVAKHCNGDMGEYCEGKEAFIKHYEAVAINWYSKLNK